MLILHKFLIIMKYIILTKQIVKEWMIYFPLCFNAHIICLLEYWTIIIQVLSISLFKCREVFITYLILNDTMKRKKFKKCWKNDPNFKSWLVEDLPSAFYFKCTKCQCTLELGNMGKGAITKHIKRKKHLEVDASRLSIGWSHAIMGGGQSIS